MQKIPRKNLIKGIGKIQTLVGRALAAYQNDRDPMRADNVKKPLEEAFNLCVELRATDEP